MASPYAIFKLHAFGRGLLGVLLILFGLQLLGVFRVVVVVLGTWLCARSFTRLIRIWAHEQRLLDESRRTLYEFSRATLPRQVFWLLLAVAEVDGRAEAEERELVRRFLLERFVDPVTAQDLRTWEAHRIPTEQIDALALHLRRILGTGERETLFYWCCLITFADGTFKQDERAILRRVSRGLGLDADHARLLFHHAKARHLGTERGAGGTGFRPGGARPTPQLSARQRALQVLGLDDDATPEDVRRRHRELVKLHHPDAHAHLGPVAAEEAAKRFREVQEAYELLGPSS